jgi:hypothetical protein
VNSLEGAVHRVCLQGERVSAPTSSGGGVFIHSCASVHIFFQDSIFQGTESIKNNVGKYSSKYLLASCRFYFGQLYCSQSCSHWAQYIKSIVDCFLKLFSWFLHHYVHNLNYNHENITHPKISQLTVHIMAIIMPNYLTYILIIKEKA